MNNTSDYRVEHQGEVVLEGCTLDLAEFICLDYGRSHPNDAVGIYRLNERVPDYLYLKGRKFIRVDLHRFLPKRNQTNKQPLKVSTRMVFAAIAILSHIFLIWFLVSRFTQYTIWLFVVFVLGLSVWSFILGREIGENR